MNNYVEWIELRLINPEKNHNKYYKIFLTTNNKVIIQYGRIGSKPRQQEKSYDDELTGAAKSYFDFKIREKMKKGYEIYRKSFTNNDTKTNSIDEETNEKQLIRYKFKKITFE